MIPVMGSSCEAQVTAIERISFYLRAKVIHLIPPIISQLFFATLSASYNPKR